MKIISVSDVGIPLFFGITEEGLLTVFGPGVTAEQAAALPAEAFAAVEVLLAGAPDEAAGAKHIGHKCPDLPHYVSHTDTVNAMGRQLCFLLRSAALELTLTYQFSNDCRVVRGSTAVRNTSGENVTLEYVSSLCLGGLGGGKACNAAPRLDVSLPHSSWCKELNWRRHSMEELGYSVMPAPHANIRIQANNTGTWSVKEYLPMGAVIDRVSGEALLWQIESNNSWHWEISDHLEQLLLRLSGPTEAENGWWKTLRPGETFESVPAALAVTDGGFDAAVREMTKYRRHIVRPDCLDTALPVIFNDYMDCLWASPTVENELPMIEKAAALGAEYYCMDAGWYAEGSWWTGVGEWQVSEKRFHGDAKQIFDAIRAHGMIPGIWVEPEVMGVDCPLVPAFRDCFFMRHGKPVISRGRYQLDFRKQKVTDHLNAAVDRLIDELGIGYFKFDYNIDPGVGTETDADSAGDGLLQAGRAYLAWVDGLYARHPGLKIENCSSGGQRMEYGMLRHHCIQSVSDAHDYHEFAYMSANAPSALLPEQTGIWVCPSVQQTHEENAFAAVNGLLHRPYMSGRIDLLDETDFALMRDAVTLYKDIRGELVGSLPYLGEHPAHYEDDWVTAGRIGGDGKHLFVTAGRIDGGETKTLDLTAVPGAKSGAAVLYPAGVGSAVLAGETLTVTLPRRAAVLIRIDLA